MKTAIITGGSRGIGKACVEVFEREGWNAVATSSKQDVRDLDVCRGVVKNTIKTFGSVDCLVNNAGITKNKPFFVMNRDDWLDVMDVNVNGAFNMTKAALHSLMKSKGSIVNVSSVAAIMGLRGQVNYCTSKAALLGFTRSLAREMAAFGVRVNAVAQGLIETDMTKEPMELQRNQELMKCYVAMRRMGKPIEIAECIYFLGSEKASFVTGSLLRADGSLAGDEG